MKEIMGHSNQHEPSAQPSPICIKALWCKVYTYIMIGVKFQLHILNNFHDHKKKKEITFSFNCLVVLSKYDKFYNKNKILRVSVKIE